MIFPDKEVDGIGKEIDVMIFQFLFPPSFNLGIQFLGDSAHCGSGISEIWREFIHNVFYPAGRNTLDNHLADGDQECFLTSLEVLK